MLKMYATLEGKLNGMDFEEFEKSGQGLGFGGFCFRCIINGEDKSVHFDWDSYVANTQEDGTLLLEEGTRTFLGGFEALDDVYDSEYEKSGFSRKDLTASVLASTTEIEEFVVDYDIEDGCSDSDYLHIQSIIFEDETGSYSVSGEVLDRFNEMEVINEIQPVGDLGTYDRYDESLMDYPNESDLLYAEKHTGDEDNEEEFPF